ncbi:MAG: M23 family metallopeptidase [Alphaproteobacteria bacterium]
MLKTRLGFVRADSLRATPILQLLSVAVLAVGAGLFGHSLQSEPALQQVASNVVQSAPVQAAIATRKHIASTVVPVITKSENVVREAELDDGQTLAELFANSGATQADAMSAMNALSKIHDLRRMRAGQNVTLSFVRTAQKETFVGAVFQPEATKEVVIARNAEGAFTATMRLIPVVRQRLAAQGEIRSTLYEAGDRAGVPHSVMAGLIRIYSHDIDFQRDIQPGDRFEVLYDQPMTTHGKAVGEADVIYAALNVGGKVHPIYRVTFSDKTVDYFDDKGRSARRALLRTPVAAAHITSGFGMRMHPLLGYSKMHKGIDFGATTGTPIFAAGNGTITEVGFKSGYGRYIRIRHNGATSTAYAHMSRFGANMHRGARVSQGQVIGYVGMSGRATGPHLHYEVLVNNNQVSPMSVNLPTGRTLEGKLLADFKAGQGKIKQEYAVMLAKRQQQAPATGKSIIQASASGVAFGNKPSPSCGLRGGC